MLLVAAVVHQETVAVQDYLADQVVAVVVLADQTRRRG